MYSWWSKRECVRIRREQRCLDFWFWCWDLHFSSYVMFGQHDFPYVTNKNWFDQEVPGSRSYLSTSISSAVYRWPWGSLDWTARTGWGCERSLRVKSGPRGKNCRAGPPELPAVLDLLPEQPDLSELWAAAALDWDCLRPSALSGQSRPDSDIHWGWKVQSQTWLHFCKLYYSGFTQERLPV